MARTDNLSNFLTDVADAIREKKGSSDIILASDFDTEIENLPSGGGADLSEYFNNTLTENKTTYTPKWDYIKKIPDLIIGDNVTQVSYLFDKDYFYVNNKNNQTKVPKVICNSNVTNMRNMYASNNADSNLNQIDLSGLNTSNVTDMRNMFYNRRGITSLDFSTFDFSKVETIYQMFYNCNSLTSLDLSNFVGQSIGKTMFALNSTFQTCNSLTKIDLSNFAPTRSCDVRSMFNNCSKLEELYLDSWDLGTYQSGYNDGIFSNCGTSTTTGLTKIYVKNEAAQNWILNLSISKRPSTWTTDNVIIAGSAEDLRTA